MTTQKMATIDDLSLPLEYISHSVEETDQIGHSIGSHLRAGVIVALLGDLGAGKTTLIKGLTAASAGFDRRGVNSPTYQYLNIYPGRLTVYHFDLYRLKSEKEFLSLGFDEFFDAEGICLIEWSERIRNLLPPSTLFLKMTFLDVTQRKISIY